MSTLERIKEKLQTVYDPDFPLVDIFTMGLIYKIDVDEKEKKVFLLLTFTTPACPSADLIEQMIRNALDDAAPGYILTLEITFEPLRTFEMIKDEDLKKMFLL